MESEKCIYLKKPKVRFQIVSRQLTPTQAEAGRRLFRRLVARAQSRDRN